MKPTELLIIAYDGDRSLFTTNLTPEKASIILTAVDEGGDVIVERGYQTETEAFEPIIQILLRVVEPVGV